MLQKDNPKVAAGDLLVTADLEAIKAAGRETSQQLLSSQMHKLLNL